MHYRRLRSRSVVHSCSWRSLFGKPTERTQATKEPKLEDGATQFLLARGQLVASGVLQPQAEALISFVSTAISPLNLRVQSLKQQLSGEIGALSAEVSGVKKLVYGLYGMIFLVVVLLGSPDSFIGQLARGLASKLVTTRQSYRLHDNS